MAIQQVTPDRRSFLSGSAAAVAAAAVTLPATAFAATPSRAAWEAAMARRNQADAACLRYDRDFADPAYLRQQANPGWKAPDALWDEYERLTDVLGDAERELMKIPAPDRAALQWKLDKIIEPDAECGASWTAEYSRQLVADYRRLLGDA